MEAMKRCPHGKTFFCDTCENEKKVTYYGVFLYFENRPATDYTPEKAVKLFKSKQAALKLLSKLNGMTSNFTLVILSFREKDFEGRIKKARTPKTPGLASS